LGEVLKDMLEFVLRDTAVGSQSGCSRLSAGIELDGVLEGVGDPRLHLVEGDSRACLPGFEYRKVTGILNREGSGDFLKGRPGKEPAGDWGARPGVVLRSELNDRQGSRGRG
jgi:hypothetical protein